MNYYGAKDLADSFRTVRKNTLTIAQDIPEDKYGFKPSPESRSVAQTLTHIALVARLPMQIHGVERRTSMEGFDFMSFMKCMAAEEQKPRTKAQVIALLTEEGDKFSQWLQGVSDDVLGERVNFPAGMTPPNKTRFEMILGVKEHEMHHRGQLMMIERMIGLVPHLTRENEARRAAMMANAAAAKPA
jgi:uncharacterized damage-inducible protein DinB